MAESNLLHYGIRALSCVLHWTYPYPGATKHGQNTGHMSYILYRNRQCFKTPGLYPTITCTKIAHDHGLIMAIGTRTISLVSLDLDIDFCDFFTHAFQKFHFDIF